jgi:S-formylglutathione hydrolase FrmB
VAVHRGRLALAALAVVLATAAVVVLRAQLGYGDTHGASVQHFDVHSRLVHRTLRQTLVVPKGGAAGRPLLVFLHGRSSSPDTYLWQEFFDALDRLGGRAPAVLFVNGGDHSYYHDRAGGRWGSYVMREALPAALRRSHADGSRLAIGGISMGGFGALDIARLDRGRFCAVGGHSAALWTSAGLTAPGAFDDAADFSRHDVVGAARRSATPLGRVPIRIDMGTADPFRAADEAFVSALRRDGSDVQLHEARGGHEAAYWRRHFGEYLRFYARALARSRR